MSLLGGEEPTLDREQSAGAEGATIDESFAALTTETRRRISSSTITLGLVIVVAGIGLFSMRLITRAVADSTSSDLPPELKERIQAAETIASEERIAKTLETTIYSERQVPLSNLSKDPFVLFIVEGPKDPGTKTPDPIPIWRSEVENAVSGLVVKSIMGGGTPNALANINGRIVRVGHTIGEDLNLSREYTIKEIVPDGVVLTVSHPTFNVTHDTKVFLERRW